MQCKSTTVSQTYTRGESQAMSISELACTYAALILHDDGIKITAEKISTLVKAANVEVESYWPALFAKLLEKRSVEDLITNVGSGGGGAAVAVGGGAPGGAVVAGGGGAPAAAAAGAEVPPPVEEKKEEPKEKRNADEKDEGRTERKKGIRKQKGEETQQLEAAA